MLLFFSLCSHGRTEVRIRPSGCLVFVAQCSDQPMAAQVQDLIVSDFSFFTSLFCLKPSNNHLALEEVM